MSRTNSSTGAVLLIRGQKVMLDRDLAELYGVATKALKRAVIRNRDRFPEDFCFQLSKEEFENLRYHFGTSSWGGVRYPPYAFTEQGVAMLSSVLRSKRAAQVNIAIMRAFVHLSGLKPCKDLVGISNHVLKDVAIAPTFRSGMTKFFQLKWALAHRLGRYD